MPFWTSALSEPKRAHRFILDIPGLVDSNDAFTYAKYLAKSVTKPAYTVYTALAGMGYLRPDIQENVILSGEAPGTVNKASALNELGLVMIEEVDGAGVNVGTWQLINGFITNATFGDLNYDNDTELLNVTIQMRYDYAVYTSGPGVARAAGT